LPSASSLRWYHKVEDGINAVRTTLPVSYFDAEECAEGLKALKAYRKEWDEDRACFKDKPRHDWASDGADAFRYLSVGWKEQRPEPVLEEPKPRWASTQGGIMTVDDLIKIHGLHIQGDRLRV
jgi:hypothetical protein